VSTSEVIDELKKLPREERERIYHWLQQDTLRELWGRAKELMKDSPQFTEEEILGFHRVRPS
jgi:mRNA-degrading endonuclease RelE of RelBE toxin-antitoxin system